MFGFRNKTKRKPFGFRKIKTKMVKLYFHAELHTYEMFGESVWVKKNRLYGAILAGSVIA